ncbi:alpha/beta fold hydrolase [Actinophytocola oryzae]|uniref:Pimeloyl-ACP methyl ester carboxylesterase n=1 Tax=Actinophytocola oryzae TaxID=502181 RepID=A0A4V3FR79_9PSEU|nr:alpha/beta hydrolase [Actinophytocola oryzae]TDV42561.1 pimeloyl-ACP methyl ester carboxylesterase [Actinophytocola oryzae]
MSGADDLRAARESRAGAADRATRPGLGDTVARMVNAAVYRASRRPVPAVPASIRPHTTMDRKMGPLGPDFPSAMRIANDRVDALGLSELRTPNGTVRYLDIGHGRPVLLVHGMFGGSDAALRQLGPLIPDGFRLIVPSRFGYLGSSLPAGATPARQADVFADLLDHLGIARAAVVAVSAGATAALQMAIRHRCRVSALVLLSPNVPGSHQDERGMPPSVARFLLGSDRLMWLLRHRFPERLARFVGVPGSRALSPADRARVAAELDGLFPVARRVDGVLFDAFVSNPAVNDCDLRRVIAPTLVVHARDDALMPSWAAVGLSERVLGSRLLVIEDGGHLMLGEHPEVDRTVKELLRSIQD